MGGGGWGFRACFDAPSTPPTHTRAGLPPAECMMHGVNTPPRGACIPSTLESMRWIYMELGGGQEARVAEGRRRCEPPVLSLQRDALQPAAARVTGRSGGPEWRAVFSGRRHCQLVMPRHGRRWLRTAAAAGAAAGAATASVSIFHQPLDAPGPGRHSSSRPRAVRKAPAAPGSGGGGGRGCHVTRAPSGERAGDLS